jgi:hypothetical protein
MRVINIEMTFFIAVEGESWVVRGGWPMTMVRFNDSVLTREGMQQTKRCRKMK